MRRFIDMSGQKFGRLTVLCRAENRGRTTMWLCKCDCGNETVVSAGHLKNGHTTSCGCYRKEKVVSDNTTHNMTGTRLYRIWANMKQRCEKPSNPKYINYGARGIRLCDEWHDSCKFFEWALSNGYRDDLTIDRIDVNGDYEPSNCRWATTAEQALNRTDNHWITYNGVTQTMKEWSDELNIPYKILEHRINKFHMEPQVAFAYSNS